jgi:Protein of unknown function (DUF1579)
MLSRAHDGSITKWLSADLLAAPMIHRRAGVPMMIYLGKPGSGPQMPIELTGTFTDPGVVGEKTVGKPIGQRTVIRIESADRHVFELYFAPPGGKEQLAMRAVYTRVE